MHLVRILSIATVLACGVLWAAPAHAGGTMTFNNLSGSPYSYTEGGFYVYSNYSSSGHMHDGTGSGGGSTGINNHTSCCSTPYRFRKSNSGTFSLSQLTIYGGSGSFSSSKGGSQSYSGSGQVTFNGSLWQDITWFEWSAGSNTDLDNVVWTDCTAPNGANAGGPYTVAEGSSTTLSGSGSGDPTLSYDWDFTGNGSYVDANGASVTFNAASSAGVALNGPTGHTVGMELTSSGCSGTSTDTVNISVTNVDPTASATFPSSAGEGGSVSFTGSGTDPGPDTLSYTWNFGDGSTSNSQNPSHTYADNGTYTVNLCVDDQEDATCTASPITITNENPVVTAITGALNATEGGTESYSATVVDLSSVDVAAGFTYAWSLSATGQTTQTSTSATPSFTFPDDGTWTLALAAQDKDGGIGTSSISINVSNANPTASISGSASGTEGSAITWTGSATDPGGDSFTYAWAFGDGNSGTGATVSHTYQDEGTYTVTLTVTDDDGGTDNATQNVNVANVAPVIGTFTIPATGNEASPLAFAGSATDAGVLDVLSYVWDFGDGNTSNSQTAAHTYADEGTGSYTVTLTVTDGDGGSDTQSGTVSVANVPPVASAITGPTVGVESQSLSWSASGTDVGTLDTLSYAWDFGDGNSATGTSATHAYNQDGTYTVTFTVTDNDGATDSSSITVVVSNTAPEITSVSGPTTGDEGSALTFAGVATDASPIDQASLTWSWDWDDATSAGTGSGPSHTWMDEGSYTVTATVTDPGGLTDTDTYAVTINNVAPTIVTSAPGFGDENVLYSYDANATDPGADTITWTLSASSPANATVDATGLVEWTPDYTQVGPNAFVITADDGDGGTDVQSWTVVVGFADLDGDGMADTWETTNGFDPTTDDSGLDPDGDGLTNLDEFLNGQDPNVSDLPDPPVLVDPIQGAEVSDPRPWLGWDEAVDPNGDDLTYDVEVYEDAAMTLLVTTATMVDALTWQVDSILVNENADYYWRARAHDGWGYSVWSDLEDFFLNELNEAPGMPTALYPVGGEQVGTLTPTIELDEGVDPDRDAVGHRVRIWNGDGTEVLTEGWIPWQTRAVDWQIDITLEEDTLYLWDAQAEDEHGLTSDWIDPEPFFATSENDLPLDVRWTSPSDEEAIESTSPVMTYTLSVDPEGRSLEYEIDLSLDSGYTDAITFVQDEDSAGSLDLDAEGTTLDENVWWFARVRATDQDGGSSAWDEVTFFVRGANDAPPVPALISPEDGATLTDATPVLAVGHVVDPDGDVVLYDIQVSLDAEGAEVLGSVSGLTASTGPEGTADQTSWRTDVNLTGEVYWTARAVDEFGAASDWAAPFRMVLDTGEPEGPAPDDVLSGGCSTCDGEASFASADNPAGWLALAALFLVPAVRRRR